MDTLGNQLAEAKVARASALEKLGQLDSGKLELAKGMTESRARELLRLSIADYDAIIERLGWRDA